jgi:hypothetical protein
MALQEIPEGLLIVIAAFARNIRSADHRLDRGHGGDGTVMLRRDTCRSYPEH